MTENFLESAIHTVLPYIVNIVEIMGIAVVTWSGFIAFFRYVKDILTQKKGDFMFKFSEGLATALEFKMAAEILKTVLIKEMSELLVLAAIILLRAFLSVLIRFEMKHKKKDREQLIENETKIK